MARAILSVGIAIFLSAILALSSAQALKWFTRDRVYPIRYNAIMARHILSVSLALFLAAILALAFAQATSAAEGGVVTAENVASAAQPDEVPRVQRHRKLPSDGSSCQATIAQRMQTCNAYYNMGDMDNYRRCVDAINAWGPGCSGQAPGP
ncbi:unnamed protein product [Closterium sp. Yama58-4]|nr:unnamed protein product [Closterium sp. Yama58-4]